MIEVVQGTCRLHLLLQGFSMVNKMKLVDSGIIKAGLQSVLSHFRGCRPEASCQPVWEPPRCWAWRPSVYTTPGDQSIQRSVLQTEQQLQGRGLWSSQDLQGGNKRRFYEYEYALMSILMWQIQSGTLTTWHTEGWPNILCTPVWSQRWAVDDRVSCVSRHDRTKAITPASYSHKNSGYAITWGKAYGWCYDIIRLICLEFV